MECVGIRQNSFLAWEFWRIPLLQIGNLMCDWS